MTSTSKKDPVDDRLTEMGRGLAASLLGGERIQRPDRNDRDPKHAQVAAGLDKADDAQLNTSRAGGTALVVAPSSEVIAATEAQFTARTRPRSNQAKSNQAKTQTSSTALVPLDSPGTDIELHSRTEGLTPYEALPWLDDTGDRANRAAHARESAPPHTGPERRRTVRPRVVDKRHQGAGHRPRSAEKQTEDNSELITELAPPEPSLYDLQEEPTPGAVRSAFEWFMVLGSAIALAAILQHFVIQMYEIPSESMYPTLKDDDRVAVSKLSFKLGDGPSHGDVIVFKRPASLVSDDPDQPKQLIKRVIGLAGETVEARGGVIYVDGEPVDESGEGGYLNPSVVTNNLTDAITVPSGEVFVMGDNREHSYDSRYFGSIPKSDIIGRAVAVSWPFDRWSSL